MPINRKRFVKPPPLRSASVGYASGSSSSITGGNPAGLDNSLAALLAQVPGFGYDEKPALKQTALKKRPKRSQVNPQNSQGIHSSSLGRRFLLGKAGAQSYGMGI